MSDLNIVKQKQEDIHTITKHLNSILRQQSGIAAAYLLGSAITRQLRNDSDIDIALLPAERHTIPLQSRLELAALLETRLNRTVDIGILTSKNLIYANEAILKGQRVVTLQKDYTETMETRLLGCYFVFKQDRKEVEEAYHAT